MAVRIRIRWIQKLVDDGIIAGLQFPINYYINPHMVDMLKPQACTMQFPFGKENTVEQISALTDELEVVNEPVTVKNPRWEHKRKDKTEVEQEGKNKDEVKGEKTEGIAAFGDAIILMVDVTGIPEGASMTFDIYDTSELPPMRVDCIKGKNGKGIAQGEWVVTDKCGKGVQARLEFEGVVKSKVSERCGIPIKTLDLMSIDVYFEDDNGSRISRISPNRKVNLIVKTSNGIGKIIDVDLSDTLVDFKYIGVVLENDILRDLVVTSNLMKVEMYTIKGR